MSFVRCLVILPFSLLAASFALGCSSSPPVSLAPSADASADAFVFDAKADAAPVTSIGGGFVAKSASFRISRSTGGDHVIDVILADSYNACGAKRVSAATDVLHLTLRTDAPPAPGKFAIVDDVVMGGSGPAPQGTATFWTIRDLGKDKCSLTNTDHAVLGTVTLTAVNESRVEGVIDIIGGLEGAAPVEGSFAATPCRSVDLSGVGCPLVAAD